jgi:hypothetical protein
MKTYKELRDELFEEVEKIDISQLGLGFNGLSSYVDLLEKMSKLPNTSTEDLMKDAFINNICSFAAPTSIKKTEKE